MKNLAMMVHFKTRNRGAHPGGPLGGYGWVYGRYSEWEAFQEAVTRHFRRHFHYDIVDFDDRRSIDGQPRNTAAASLVDALDRFPIQFQTLHFYTADER